MKSSGPGRAFQDAASVPLVGGRLCLDFVNTTGARASAAPRERLRVPADLLTWAGRAGLLDAALRRDLESALRRHPRRAATDLGELVDLRECLEAGFADLLAKPVAYTTLEETIRRVVG